MTARHRIRTYGLTPQVFDKMMTAQDGKCPICETLLDAEVRDLCHIDHCHNTGVVRGILCKRCNLGIGFMNDDVEILKRAINYLNDSST